MADFDTSELAALEAQLRTAAAKVIPAVTPSAHRAGANIKSIMKKDASGHRRLGGLPRYVEYDVERSAASLSVEVGFRKEGQGNLANIAAFGTPNNAPVMDITRGLREEVPNFMRWVAKLAGEAL